MHLFLLPKCVCRTHLSPLLTGAFLTVEFKCQDLGPSVYAKLAQFNSIQFLLSQSAKLNVWAWQQQARGTLKIDIENGPRAFTGCLFFRYKLFLFFQCKMITLLKLKLAQKRADHKQNWNTVKSLHTWICIFGVFLSDCVLWKCFLYRNFCIGGIIINYYVAVL